MSHRSASVSGERPFYDAHAASYDALITDPVEPWVNAIAARAGGSDGDAVRILDAGCGTGRHAAGLIALGYDVTLLDASEELLAVARRRCPSASAFHGDICAPNLTGPFSAIACRGVLNDLVEDDERDAALTAFARLLQPAGTALLDLRETTASQRRADGRWRRSEALLPDGGRLVFSSRPTWRDGRIVVDERYELTADHTRSTREYSFTMRPWTLDEVDARLTRAGFERIEIAGGVGRRTEDRLFVTCQVPAQSS